MAYKHAHAIAQEMGEINVEIETASRLAHLYILLGDRLHAQALGQSRSPRTEQNVPPHTRFIEQIIVALLNWMEGNLTQALAAATQAWTLSGKIRNRCEQACALVYLGHVQTGLQQWKAAAATFQQALTLFVELRNPALATELQAGLAQLALRQGNATAAQLWVEAILPVLVASPRVGVTTPFYPYLTCYRVLAANADLRATAVLRQGYALLQQDAAVLDEESRYCFLEAVPIHRALREAYAELQA